MNTTYEIMVLSTPDALARLTPGAKWTMTNINDYETLVWNDDTQTQPTWEECTNMFTQIKHEKYMKNIRSKRNLILGQTDKYATADYPHPTPEDKQKWTDYRQSLRDFPALVEDPENPIWPVPPMELDEVILEKVHVFKELPLVQYDKNGVPNI
jgi:hypothetical protein